MAGGNLGNLWYELDIKDNSQARLQNIIKGIEAQLASAGKKGVTVGNITIDPKAGQMLVAKLRNILQNSGGLKIDKLDVGKALRLQIDTKNIQEQLERHTFRGKLALDVNPTELQAAVSRALRGIPSVSASQLINIGGSAASVNSTTDAVRNLNKQMNETSAIGKKVQSALTQAFSVYAVKSFLSEVINIGGELEKQRLAMGNILGDMYEANELTKKISNLSMISPFTVQELTKATRLLTAYGVEYNEVYDITKRLSDIAAGVGVGFERIAYAFGHITSMGNLDARTLRMFQNMGVPLLQKLSDYYQQTQGKTFSTAQVRKMITDRQVSSSDVINVLKQMTDAGGQFYQMQEVMAESLATKWANLANAWNLMLGSMAEDPAIGGNLKSLAEVLTAMTQNWKNVRAAMIPVAGYLLVIKSNSLMAAQAISAEAVASQKSILAMKAKRAEYLQTKVAGWELVAANRELVATVGTLTVADYKHALKTGMVTKEMIAQVIASKQLSLQDSILIGKMAGMSAATSRLVYNFGALGMAAKAFATTLKGIAMNPMTWIFAAAEVGMQLWQNHNNEVEKVNESIDNLKQKSTEGAKNIKEALKSTEIPDSSRATLGDYKQKINDIKESLKEYDPLYQKTFRDVDAVDGQGKAVHTLQEQYEILRKRLLGVKDAYEGIYDMSSVPTDLNSKTGDGWFDKTYSETAESYQKALDGVNSYVNKLMADKDKLEDTYKSVFNNIEVAMSKTGGESLKKWQAMKKELEGMTTTADKLRHILTSEGRGGFNSYATGIVGTDFQIIEKLFSASQGLKINTQKLGESLRNYLESEGLKYGDAGWEMKAKMIMDSIMNLTSLPENAKMAIEKGFFTTTGIIKWVDEGDIPAQDPYSRGNAFKDRQYDAIDILVKKGEGVFTEAEKESRQNAATTIKDIVKNGEDSVDTIEKMQSHIETLRKDIKQLEKADDDESKKQKERLKYELQYAEAAAKAAKYSTSKPKNTTGGNGGDAVKKGFEEEIQLAKEAYDEYKKWYDLLNNEALATAKVGENPLFKNADGSAMFGNPKDIRGNYEAILEKIGERYPDLQRKLQSAIFDFDYDKAKDNAAKAVSEMKEQIDRETKNWNLYQKLFDATGAKEWAWKMANQAHKVWDEQATLWAGNLSQKMMERTGDVEKSFGFSWDMSEEQAKKYFGEDGDLVELYLATKKRIEQNGIDFWGNFADITKESQTFADKIAVLKETRDRELANAASLGLPKEEIDKMVRYYNDQIGKLEFEKAKFDLNWDTLLGGATSAEKSLLKGARDAMKKFKKSPEYQAMNPVNQESVNKAIADMTKAIEDKPGGFFGGLIDATKQLDEAFVELQIAQAEYNRVAENGTETEKELAKQRLKNAEEGVYSGQDLVKKEQKKIVSNVNSVANAAKALGQATEHPLQAVGSALGSIGAMLGSTGEMWTGIIGAIFTLLDAIGDDANKFMGNIFENIGQAIGSMFSAGFETFGIDGVFGILDKADYKGYDEMVEKFGALEDVWSSIIEKKKEYIGESWGEEAANAAEEAKRIVDAELEVSKALAQKRLESGSSAGSHSIDYRMWKGSYESVYGRNWKDVAKEISDTYNVQFSQMSDMLNMSGETLQSIKENYSDLWAAMDGDFRKYLENIIEYEDKLQDIEEKANDQITQTSFDSVRKSFLDTLMDMESSAEDFANDFAKLMMNAMVNNYLLGDSFTEWLNGWMEKMNSAIKNKDIDAQNELNREAQKKREELLSERDSLASMLNYQSGEQASSMTTGIKGISEQTADLLASYINGIRADVSISRSILESLDLSSLNAVAASQLAQLNMIAANTEAIMRSNASIDDNVSELRDVINAGFAGTKKLYIQ